MNAPEIVLGIDPGLATVGFAILSFKEKSSILDFGVIETTSGEVFEDRVIQIYNDLQELIEIHSPDLIVLEELFFSSNAKTAIDVAQCRGALIAASGFSGSIIRSIKPNQVKLGFTGDGSADKKQMQEMVKLHFSLESVPKPDDAADAIAIAYVGYQEYSHEL
jgi:crossover junction endodeoxyribonuclease RuvC